MPRVLPFRRSFVPFLLACLLATLALPGAARADDMP